MTNETNRPNRLLLKVARSRDLDAHVARLEMTHFGDPVDEWLLTSIRAVLKRNKRLERALMKAHKISQHLGKAL